MNKLILMCLVLLLFSSCSTARRSMTYGGVIGGLIGASIGVMVGQKLSPEGKANQIANSALGGTLGALVGGGSGVLLGKYFYGEDPTNRELKQMILPKRPEKEVGLVSLELGRSNVELKVDINSNTKYMVPTDKIPENIKMVMKKPYLIEHKVKGRVIRLDDLRTIYIPEFTVLEQTFED